MRTILYFIFKILIIIDISISILLSVQLDVIIVITLLNKYYMGGNTRRFRERIANSENLLPSIPT